MDKRKNQVLKTVVRLYSLDGEPVGSTLLARHFSMAVSSATLRSEMAALTKLGLLEQPHTSAGRIPSVKGYRYYIDNLMDSGAPLTQIERKHIKDLFVEMDFDPQRITIDTAKALAFYTGFAAATTTPESKDMCIAHFEIVRVGLYAAVVLAVTNAGGVLTRTAKFAKPLETKDLKVLEQILNKFLTFVNPKDLDLQRVNVAVNNLSNVGEFLLPGILAATKIINECDRQIAHIEGQENLLKHGISDVTLRNLLALFSNNKAACSCLSLNSVHTSILLGEDIYEYPLPGYCIIGKQYYAGGGRTGVISIIGPSRMNFIYMMSRLEYFAQILSEYMSGKSEEANIK